MICQDCWEPYEDNPLCICRASNEPCPVHGGYVFTTPREKQDGVCPINCPKNPRCKLQLAQQGKLDTGKTRRKRE